LIPENKIGSNSPKHILDLLWRDTDHYDVIRNSVNKCLSCCLQKLITWS